MNESETPGASLPAVTGVKEEEIKFPHNPDHAVGTCSKCGGEMVYNVPRLGPGGGFVHKASMNWSCLDAHTASDSAMLSFNADRKQIEESVAEADRAHTERLHRDADGSHREQRQLERSA